MDDRSVIEHALQAAAIEPDIQLIESLSGGCIFQARRVVLTDGQVVVAKLGSLDVRAQFEEEATGLLALTNTNTVIAPHPHVVATYDDSSVLLMEWIEPASANREAWANFGLDLAKLHASDVGTRYGFDIDNHIGATRQVNTWCDDWVEFIQVHRFGFQLKLARTRGLIEASDAKSIERFIDRLESFMPRQPKPALLHGDLWSGNALPTVGRRGGPRGGPRGAGGCIAVIDPAPYVGDGWADIAMMRLFGGFDEVCFASYSSHVGKPDHLDTRIMCYQVYHLLNHVNIFGRSYLGQTMSMIHRLVG